MLKKLAGQTAIYGVSNILSRLLHLLLTPLYTNLFEPSVYGIYTNLYAYVAFVQLLLTFGMETTFFRYIQREEDTDAVYGRAFGWVALITGVFMLLFGLLHRPIAQGMGYAGSEHLVLLMIGIISLDVLAALPLANLRQQEKVMKFSVITLVNSLTLIGLNVVLVLVLKLGITYVFVANLIASAVRLGLTLYGNLPKKISLNPVKLRPMISYGYYIMLAGFAGTMNETLDRVLIPKLWTDGNPLNGVSMTGEALNGIYGANYKLAMLIALAAQAFRYAAEPFYFKEAGKKESPQAFAKVFHYVMMAAMIGFVLVASFASEIAAFNLFGLTRQTFIGRQYWSGLEVVPILLMAYVFSTAYQNFSIWFKLTDQTRYAILFTGVGAVLTIAINVATIPTMGYIGSAWATLISYGVMAVMCYYLGQQRYPIPYKIGRLLIYLSVCVVAFWFNRQIGPTGDFWLAAVFKMGIVLAAGVGIFGWERWRPAVG